MNIDLRKVRKILERKQMAGIGIKKKNETKNSKCQREDIIRSQVFTCAVRGTDPL